MAGLLILLSSVYDAHAALIYESFDGASVIYDSSENIAWTQNADISGDTYTFQNAQTWAADLSVGEIGAGNWGLPDVNQFTSLYDQLDGTGDKYGAQVFFGIGTNDYASNVAPEYWTGSDLTDFNFYYGYPGYKPDSSDFAAWAVTAVPEPSVLTNITVALVMMVGVMAHRRISSVATFPSPFKMRNSLPSIKLLITALKG